MDKLYYEMEEAWKKEQVRLLELKTQLSCCGFDEAEKEQVRRKLQAEAYHPKQGQETTEGTDWLSYPRYFLMDTGLYNKEHYHELVDNLWNYWKSGGIQTEGKQNTFLVVLEQCLSEMTPMLFEYYSSIEELIRMVQRKIEQKRERTTGRITGIHKLFEGSTHVVLELEGTDIYQTEKYEIRINGMHQGENNKMVFSIYDLQPNMAYMVEIKGNKWSQVIAVCTKKETVTVNVKDFGAIGDGKRDETFALQAAVLACPKKGRVYIPAGRYKFYQIFLKSDITIELARGSLLEAYAVKENRPVLPGSYVREDTEFEEETDIYDLASWEGNPLDCYASILTGIEVENVVICGQGTIDGGGDFHTWWVNEKKYPVMDWKKVYRPKMCFLNRCRNIVIQGVTFTNSPSWNMHPYFSENIRFYDITIISPEGSHNTDGIDPESCKNVEIIGVHFSVGDDCVAIKSGKIYMGKKRQTPSRNIKIRQCFMEKGHGGVTIGSEVAGGAANITVTSCRFLETDRGLRIKTRRGRGRQSIIDRIEFDHVHMEKVKSPFVINEFYFCDPDGKSEYVSAKHPLPVDERTPEIRNIRIRNTTCKDAAYAGIYIYGLPEKKIESVEIHNTEITFDSNAPKGIPAMMTGCEPVKGLGVFIRNVVHKELSNVVIEGEKVNMDDADSEF